MLAGDLHEPVRLLQRRPGPVAILAGEDSRVLAGGREAGSRHLEVARAFLDDPAGEHAPLAQLLRARADLLHIEQPGIGAEDLLAVAAEHAVLKPFLDRLQGRVGGQCVEQGLDVAVDRGRPIGRFLRDLPVGLAPADIVAGHADVGARHFGQRVSLG
ncbi:MAG: hypothetical protein ACK559_01780, partial [bacterium]